MIDEFPKSVAASFTSSGKDTIREIGDDVIKDVVLDVLTGKNIRDSTELLTRKRIATINAATLATIIRCAADDPNFIATLPKQAVQKLQTRGLPKHSKWIYQWSLGLTDKGMQNILRDDTSGLERYLSEYEKITRLALQEFADDYGDFSGTIELGDKLKTTISWALMLQLMTVIGSQTLTIRGADKSKFGKLFEKLVLGSLLTMLGFKMVEPGKPGEARSVFWLSQRENKRESDATAIYAPGKGARFDIGFIGRGNSEISLDKVSRFERDIEIGTDKYYMATIIVVDRIGVNSRIEELAKVIDGNIVQMSGSYWPLQVAQILHERLGYSGEILKPGLDVGAFLADKIKSVPFPELFDFTIDEEVPETELDI